MAGRFEFQSPGAAFTGQISQLLSQRKADERQKLIDSLSFSADQRAQENADREAAESKQRLANEKLRNQLTQITTVAGNMKMGDDPTTRGLDPETIETGKKYAFWDTKDVPQVTTSIDGMQDPNGQAPTDFTPEHTPAPPPQKRLSYVGSQKEREEEDMRKEEGSVITSMLSSGDPEKVQHGEMLATVAALSKDHLIPVEYLKFLDRRPTMIMHQETGDLTKGPVVSGDTQILTQSRPPHEPLPRNPFPIGVNEKNEPIYSDQNFNTHTFSGVTARTPSSTGNKAVDSLGIPKDSYEAHMGNIFNLKPNEHGSVDASDMTMVRYTANRLVESSRANDTAKRLAIMYINHDPNYAKAAAKARETGQLDDKTLAQVEQLKSAIVPAEYQRIFELNPPVQYTKATK